MPQELENWTDLHPDFAKNWGIRTCQQSWEKIGCTYSEAQDWLAIGFTPQDYEEVQKWRKYSFTPAQTQAWLVIGLTIKDYAFADYLNYKYQQPSWDLPWPEIILQGIPAQEYLDWKYPTEGTCLRKDEDRSNNINNYGRSRAEVTHLNISKKNLTGELDLTSFSKLEVLLCDSNQLTKLTLPLNNRMGGVYAYSNLLTTFDYEQLNPDTLTDLYLNNNNLAPTELTVFSHSHISDYKIASFVKQNDLLFVW